MDSIFKATLMQV